MSEVVTERVVRLIGVQHNVEKESKTGNPYTATIVEYQDGEKIYKQYLFASFIEEHPEAVKLLREKPTGSMLMFTIATDAEKRRRNVTNIKDTDQEFGSSTHISGGKSGGKGKKDYGAYKAADSRGMQVGNAMHVASRLVHAQLLTKSISEDEIITKIHQYAGKLLEVSDTLQNPAPKETPKEAKPAATDEASTEEYSAVPNFDA